MKTAWEAAPALSGPSGVEVRRATLADLHPILALESGAFGAGQAAGEPPFGQEWSPWAWTDDIDNHFVAVATGNGRFASGVIGVVSMSLVADSADLRRVILAAPRRGKGIGRALVRAGLAWAVDQGAQEVFLEVAASNDSAIRLYDSLGFAPIDRRTGYYGPDADAVVYRWRPGDAAPIRPRRDHV